MNHLLLAAALCNPCTIHGDTGGVVSQYVHQAQSIHRHGKLIIDGYCASACMTMAAFARPHACITPQASFMYHMTNYNRPIPLPRDLMRWVVRGGVQNPQYMSYSEAVHYWPTCLTIK